MEEEKLIEAVEKIRRDKHQPWNYILFTFLNGIAQGLGVALGATLVLGMVIYILSIILSKTINFPVLGHYSQELARLIEVYAKQGAKLR